MKFNLGNIRKKQVILMVLGLLALIVVTPGSIYLAENINRIAGGGNENYNLFGEEYFNSTFSYTVETEPGTWTVYEDNSRIQFFTINEGTPFGSFHDDGTLLWSANETSLSQYYIYSPDSYNTSIKDQEILFFTPLRINDLIQEQPDWRFSISPEDQENIHFSIYVYDNHNGNPDLTERKKIFHTEGADINESKYFHATDLMPDSISSDNGFIVFAIGSEGDEPLFTHTERIDFQFLEITSTSPISEWISEYTILQILTGILAFLWAGIFLGSTSLWNPLTPTSPGIVDRMISRVFSWIRRKTNRRKS